VQIFALAHYILAHNHYFCVQGAITVSERDFSASGYTVWDRRNAILP
jgi:hypothetical protein